MGRADTRLCQNEAGRVGIFNLNTIYHYIMTEKALERLVAYTHIFQIDTYFERQDKGTSTDLVITSPKIERMGLWNR